jgi:hypothetical protein
MVRFHVWFLVLALVGGPLAAGYFLGFDALDAETLRGVEASVREDAALGQAKLARFSDESIREAALVAQRAALHEPLLPLAAAAGSPLEAGDRIKAALERAKAPGDLIAIADARGAVLLRIKEAQNDLALPMFTDALRGQPTAQVIAYRGRLYWVAVAPILSGTQIVGAIALGQKASTEWVQRLVGPRGGGVAVAYGGKVVASNLGQREAGELTKHLGQLQAGRVKEVVSGPGSVLATGTTLGQIPGALVVYARPAPIVGGLSDARLLYLYIAGGVFLFALFWAFLLQRAIARPATLLLSRVHAFANSHDPAASVSAQGLASPWAQIAAAVNEALSRTRAWAQGVVATRKSAPTSAIAGVADVAEPAPAAPATAAAESRIAATAPTMVIPSSITAAAPAPSGGAAMLEARPAPDVEWRPPVSPAADAAAPVPPAAPPAAASFDGGRTLMGFGAFGGVPPTQAPQAPEVASPAVPSAPPAPDDPLASVLPALHERFLAVRRECAESTDDVTFDRFARKVRRVREELMEQHRCDEVQFEVYVRAGRATLKAVPRRAGTPAVVH